LDTAAVVPSLVGTLAPVGAVWRTDDKSIELLGSLVPDMPFLAGNDLPKEAAPLADLCDVLTAGGAIAHLRAPSLNLTAAQGKGVVGWFAQREVELSDEDKRDLAALAI